MVALVLLAHVAQGIEAATLVELVERDDVSKVQHVNLFQLGSRAVLRRHYVEAYVGVLDNLGVRLPDAAGFEDNQVEIGGLHHVYRVLHVAAQGQVALARS